MPVGASKGTTDEASNHQVVIAGATAGVVSRFVVAPLDVVKIRLQLQPHSLLTSSSSSQGQQQQILYRGILGTFKTILRQEGITGLWKGNIPAELLYLSYGATQFYTYRQLNIFLSSSPSFRKLPDPLTSSISGAIAGATATTVTYPLDLLRTRFAAVGPGRRVYDSLWKSFRDIKRTEGYGGFFRGLGAGLAQIIPHMGLFFGSYETVRAALTASPSFSSSSTESKEGGGGGGGGGNNKDKTKAKGKGGMFKGGLADSIAGVIGGIIAKTGVFPLDTVRKRLQVQGPTRTMYVHGDAVAVYDKGIIRCVRDIVVKEGVRGLYKGLLVSLVKAAPASAVTMWTFGRAMEVVKWIEE